MVNNKEIAKETAKPKYIGVIKYKITDIIYSINSSIQKDAEINILTGNTSYRWFSEAIDQVIGDEYIIFSRAINDKQKQAYNLNEETKFYLPDPFRHVVTISDTIAKFDGVFTSLAQKAEPSNRRRYMDEPADIDCYALHEQDFITEIKKAKDFYMGHKATSAPNVTVAVETIAPGGTTPSEEPTSTVESTSPAEL